MTERKPTQQQKQAVFERAGGCCEDCLSRADFSPSLFSAEHILPRHHGGTNGLDNLVLACQACDNHKFTSTEGLDLGSGQVAPLYHLRRH